MSNEVATPQQELSNIDKIKMSLSNLNDKKNKIMFFVPDVNGVPAASIYELYFHGSVLKSAGYDVYMLTETNKFQIPDFIEKELTELNHVSMESNTLTVSPEDLIIIPEIFTNVMEQTKNLPCMRVVLFQSIDNATKALLPGYDWTMFGINQILTTSKTMERFVEEFYGRGKFSMRSYNVSVPEYFKNKFPLKRPVISILTRNENELDKLIKLFLSKYPQYRWLNFEPMLTNSKPPKHLRRKDFAEKLGKNFAALWIDRISSHALFPLECMKAGTIPISYIPDVTPEYLIGADGKGVQNAGVWTDDFFQIPTLIADTLRKFLDDEIPQAYYDDMKAITDKYSPEVSSQQLLDIYRSYFVDRTNSLTAALNAMQPKPVEVAPQEVQLQVEQSGVVPLGGVLNEATTVSDVGVDTQSGDAIMTVSKGGSAE
jgi:hypothetical protein